MRAVRIVVTGSEGFIGRNLLARLGELGHSDVIGVSRKSSANDIHQAIAGAEFVFHLAGVNRPQDPAEFTSGNLEFTKFLCDAAETTGRRIPILFTSSTQFENESPYGASKRAAERVLQAYNSKTSSPVYLFRLTNVFGKWSRPYYNSAVATFCHQISRGLPINVAKDDAALRLVFVDDVIDTFIRFIADEASRPLDCEIWPVYETTVGAVAAALQEFRESRTNLVSPPVGVGLIRALYSTYLSFLPTDAFSYQVPTYVDPRGEFVEMLKTADCGQFSYFTAHPGVTRGEHYHHTKTEKFLIVTGRAEFGFRHMQTNERFQLSVNGGEGRIIETAPGWAHKVTNIGDELLVVMLWVSEIFDRTRPDTVAVKVDA